MIRVVKLDIMQDFRGYMRGRVVCLCRISSSLLVVSGCTGGYGDLEERVRCVCMGVDVTSGTESGASTAKIRFIARFNLRVPFSLCASLNRQSNKKI